MSAGQSGQQEPEASQHGRLTLRVTEQRLAICRLPRGAALPERAQCSAFFSLTCTPEETSLVCSESDTPPDAACSLGWRRLQVLGPLDLSLIGVLAGLAAALASAGVSIFALSTYDTDHLLVREEQLAAAVAALRQAGYRVLEL